VPAKSPAPRLPNHAPAPSKSSVCAPRQIACAAYAPALLRLHVLRSPPRRLSLPRRPWTCSARLPPKVTCECSAERLVARRFLPPNFSRLQVIQIIAGQFFLCCRILWASCRKAYRIANYMKNQKNK
jgi:hypothetical protein